MSNLSELTEFDGPQDIPVLRQIIIPARLKQACLERLAAMRITTASLFPGLDGLAQSLPRREWLDWYDS